jgi:hypothetical protein
MGPKPGRQEGNKGRPFIAGGGSQDFRAPFAGRFAHRLVLQSFFKIRVHLISS